MREEMQNAERGMQNEEGPSPRDLVIRTREFSLSVIRVFAALDKDTVSQVIGRQLLRSATSVGAHYREARRARSVAEFVSKMEGGLQELEETAYWFELLLGAQKFDARKLTILMQETDELTSIFIASVRTAKKKRHR